MRSTFAVLCRLKPDFDESGYTGPQKVILAALKRHGMSDGGEIALTFADDRTSTAKWADLGIDAQTFSDIGVDQFDVVELRDGIPLTYDARVIPDGRAYRSGCPMCLPSSAREWMPSLR